jgi:uncharacterized protein YjbJ (UPF0337 family)
MEWPTVQTQWKQVKPKLHTKWTKLTDSDLEAIHGRREELVKRLATRYEMERPKAEKAADEFVKTLTV